MATSRDTRRPDRTGSSRTPAEAADAQQPALSRRGFIERAGAAVGITALAGCASSGAGAGMPTTAPTATDGITRTYAADRFDPWIELDAAAWRHNVREASRLASGRPILAVIKNNAYGLGDRTVGPLVADMPEVGGIACVRVEEALTLRAAGVTKPIVVMAEGSEADIEELARNDVMPSVWLDDAHRRLQRVSRRLGRPVPVQLFVDTGMNREGMPYTRAKPWLEELIRSDAVDVNGTYTMFSHDMDFDLEQLARFEELLAWGRARSLPFGTLHASPTFELFHLPAAHYDMVRPGNALFGNYPSGEGARGMAELKPVFRFQTRVVRVERLEPGDSAGFYRTFEPQRATWVALLPVGRTDGYPSEANGTCEVLIGGRLYPVAGGVNSAHTILDIGPEKTVDVGDVATLIGPDDDAILPHTVADRTGVGFLRIIQGINPRLPRRIV